MILPAPVTPVKVKSLAARSVILALNVMLSCEVATEDEPLGLQLSNETVTAWLIATVNDCGLKMKPDFATATVNVPPAVIPPRVRV